MSGTHVPAWRRLGLKLKYAKDDIHKTQPNQRVESSNNEEPPSKKRRTTTGDDSPTKAANETSSLASSTPTRPNKVRKQVSFSSDTKTTDGDSAVSIIPSETVEETIQPSDSKKSSRKQKAQTQPSTVKSQGTLQYLTQFYTSNSTWKFNKNREVWILKHALSTSDIPPSYNLPLAQYIHGLKSPNARDRLRLEAAGAASGEAMPQDLAEKGARLLASFPEGVVSQDTGMCSSLVAEMILVSRPRLILWALDPTNATGSELQSGKLQNRTAAKSTDKIEKPQKKRKNRTAVVEYSSSSSSSSASEGESESESETSSSESDSDGST